jgi:hypothetical protein
VGEPFDIKAYLASIPPPEKNEAGRLIREAGAELEQHLNTIKSRLGPPTRPIFPPPNNEPPPEPPPKDLRYYELLDQVLEKGWPKPKDAEEIARYLDLAFQGTWIKKIRRAVSLPLGAVLDPRTTRVTDSLGPIDQCRSMGLLLAARAVELQANGDHRGALEQLEVCLGLSRQFRSHTPGIPVLIGQSVESVALSAWSVCLNGVGPDGKFIRRALDVLKDHEAAIPDYLNAFRAELVIFRNSKPIAIISPGKAASGGRPVMETNLIRILREVPWEQERERRILDAVALGQLSRLQKPFWQKSSRNEVSDSSPNAGIAWELGLPPEHGPGSDLSPKTWGKIVRESGLALYLPSWTGFHRANARSERRLRAALLVTALALYQTENPRSAARLEDLVPHYLDKVPLDPVRGKSFDYRVSTGEEIKSFPFFEESRMLLQKLAPGQGLISVEAPDMDWRLAGSEKVLVLPVPLWKKK